MKKDKLQELLNQLDKLDLELEQLEEQHCEVYHEKRQSKDKFEQLFDEQD